jgi:hypothetical protein
MGLPSGFENISFDSYHAHLKLDNLKGREFVSYNEVMNYLASKFTSETNDLYLWDKGIADIDKLHSTLISGISEDSDFTFIKSNFPKEHFIPHFIPVPGQPLIPIPWEAKLNLLADLLKSLKQESIITLAPQVHVQAQKHFLWKGKLIDTRSFANAFKPNSNKSNAIILKIIEQIIR